MPEAHYLLAVLVIVFVIDFCLRAIPFAILKPLRESGLVQALALWMPAGLLFILAVSTVMSTARAGHWWQVLVAAAITLAVHLILGHRTLLSITAGTVTYIVLLALT